MLNSRIPVDSSSELINLYKEHNHLCELFPLLWREQPRLLETIWPGQLFSEAIAYVATETHHIWHPGNRSNLLSNLIRLSTPIHGWCQQQQPCLGLVVCTWVKLHKGETDLHEVRKASGFYLDGWLQTEKVVDRCQSAGGWWVQKREEALRMVSQLVCGAGVRG